MATNTTSPRPSTVPWYESNVLWGPLAIGAAIVLTVLPAIKHDLRWLLLAAWPMFGISIWWLARRTREVLIITILGTSLAGLGLLRLSVWLPSGNASTATVRLQPEELQNPSSEISQQKTFYSPPQTSPIPANPTAQDEVAPQKKKRATQAPRTVVGAATTSESIRQSGIGNSANPGTVNAPINQGPCSIAQTGGSGNQANVDCAPPVVIQASSQTQQPTGNADEPYVTIFTISTNVSAEIGDFSFTCDGPVAGANIDRINPYEFISGYIGPDAKDPNTLIYQTKPEPLNPNHHVTIRIFSKTPVKVLSGTAGDYQITF